MPRDYRGRPYRDPAARADLTVASAARTATATLTAFPIEGGTLHARLNVTAGAGTAPTLDLSLETTFDGTNWFSAGAFAQRNATPAAEFKSFSGLGAQVRWKFTIGGSAGQSITSTIDTVYVRRNG